MANELSDKQKLFHRITDVYLLQWLATGYMRLGDKQKLFARLVPRLIDKAHELGYEVTFGDLYRDARSHGAMGERLIRADGKAVYGALNSCHKMRLAIDLNLFDQSGKYLTTTADHQALGEWWEKQHPETAWGGRFNDANHYSISHEGSK